MILWGARGGAEGEGGEADVVLLQLPTYDCWRNREQAFLHDVAGAIQFKRIVYSMRLNWIASATSNSKEALSSPAALSFAPC